MEIMSECKTIQRYESRIFDTKLESQTALDIQKTLLTLDK